MAPRTIPSYMWLIGAAVYVIFPLDFDFVPVIGWIDDLIVAIVGFRQWSAVVKAQDEARRLLQESAEKNHLVEATSDVPEPIRRSSPST